MSFIPLIIRTKNLFSSESSLKYFLIQALASAILLFSILSFFFILNYKIETFIYFSILISSTLLLKIGAAPFHFWLPNVIEGLNWNKNLLLITWQKIAPLIIISYSINLNLLFFIIFISIIFGNLGGLNQTSLRKLIAFSSINHLGWIIAGIINNQNIWFCYLFFYILLRISVIFIFNNFKIFNINQTFKLFNPSPYAKLIIFIPLLSIGGLPPFFGFFPKWLIIENLIKINLFTLLLFILFLSLITLYFYIRISYSALILNHIKINYLIKINYTLINNQIIILLVFISIFGLIIINFLYFFL